MWLRFSIVGFGALVFVLGIVWIIAPGPKVKTSYGTEADKYPSRRSIIFSFIGKLVVISILCALAVYVMMQTATFHSIRIIRETNPQKESEGTVRVVASQFPTTLVLDAAVLQRGGLKILSFDLKPCTPDVQLTTLIGNENEFERKVQALAFQRAQCFEFSFNLTGPASSLIIRPSTKPDSVSVMSQQEFKHWVTVFNYFGGALWIIAFIVLCLFF